MKALTQIEVMNVLIESGFNVVDGELFSPEHAGAIWFHQPFTKEAENSLFIELSWDGQNINKFPITELLKPYGWYAESYDSSTLFAYNSI